MKDRQFMIVLALVVAAGLAMGLIAARMSAGGGAATVSAQAGNASVAAKPASPSASGDLDQPPQPQEQLQTAEVDSGEPRTPTVEPPEMKPPPSGDAPAFAATEPDPTGAPAPSGETVQ